MVPRPRRFRPTVDDAKAGEIENRPTDLQSYVSYSLIVQHLYWCSQSAPIVKDAPKIVKDVPKAAFLPAPDHLLLLTGAGKRAGKMGGEGEEWGQGGGKTRWRRAAMGAE